MPARRPGPSAQSNCAQTALSLKLYDCLVKVTHADAGTSVMLWLSCYLKNESGLQKDGSLQCAVLSFTRFCYDLETHFDYSPQRHEIRWENNCTDFKAEDGSKSTGTKPHAASFVVQTHNSWVTALMIMQTNNYSARPQNTGAAEASSKIAGLSSKPPPVAPPATNNASITAAEFTIVRKKDGTFCIYLLRSRGTNEFFAGTDDFSSDDSGPSEEPCDLHESNDAMPDGEY